MRRAEIIFFLSLSLVAISLWMTGTDAYLTQKRTGLVPGHVRKGETLAKAVVIDGRNDLYYRSCSETNVWTRAKCRRCKTDIPPGCRLRLLRVTGKTTCWRAKPRAQKRQSCQSDETKSRRWRRSGRSQRCSSRSRRKM